MIYLINTIFIKVKNMGVRNSSTKNKRNSMGYSALMHSALKVDGYYAIRNYATHFQFTLDVGFFSQAS